MKILSLLVLAVGLSVTTATAESADYAKEIDAARAKRVQRLTAPDGWLTLIGLHFLTPGQSTIGSAKESAVMLAAGPAELGTVTLAATGGVTLAVAPGVEARVAGEPVRVREVALGDGNGKPVIVSVGTVSLFVIDRGGRKELRVKDSEAVRRKYFVGIDYFPTEAAWRIEADWVAFDRPREVPISTMLGQVENARVPGKAVFTRDGHRIELLPMQDAPGDNLFFVISDLTSGEETYGAARFLYAAPAKDGKVVLDFNKAVNPPCAFTPFATCPLPPKENQMPIAVTAGEKNYRGEH